jgi:hypothetical protein
MHLAHFEDYAANRHKEPEEAHTEQGMTANTPREATRETRPLRRQVEETLLTLYVRIVTRKSDRAQPPTEVHDPTLAFRTKTS